MKNIQSIVFVEICNWNRWALINTTWQFFASTVAYFQRHIIHAYFVFFFLSESRKVTWQKTTDFSERCKLLIPISIHIVLSMKLCWSLSIISVIIWPRVCIVLRSLKMKIIQNKFAVAFQAKKRTFLLIYWFSK